jgi:hypothetical protein
MVKREMEDKTNIFFRLLKKKKDDNKMDNPVQKKGNNHFGNPGAEKEGDKENTNNIEVKEEYKQGMRNQQEKKDHNEKIDDHNENDSIEDNRKLLHLESEEKGVDYEKEIYPEIKKEGISFDPDEKEHDKVSEWTFIGQSVRGSLHIRNGIPNQDGILPEKTTTGKRLVVSVSDGHGGERYFRSDKGSCFAVESAKEILNNFSNVNENETYSFIKQTAEQNIPKAVVQKWWEKVLRHVKENPFSDDEKKKLREEEREKIDKQAVFEEKKENQEEESEETRRTNEEILIKTYGATLLSVLVTEKYIIYFQLGDGDILTVSESGEILRPLKRDERLIANETTSLCLKNAWNNFEVNFQRISSSPPVLIMLATDGYANSFVNDESFQKVASDIWEYINSDGIKEVANSLESWLSEASEKASGDDITVGILCRMDTVKKDNLKPGNAGTEEQNNLEAGKVDFEVNDKEEIKNESDTQERSVD